MALTDDQKALLRLLAQQERGYDDIAAVMGLSVEQVRSRAREALAALDEDPEARAAAASAPQAANPPHAAPDAPPRQAPPALARPSSPLLRLRLPRDRRRLYELVGGAVVVILLILFATGVVNIGGGGSGSSAGPATGTAAEEPGATGESPRLTQAVLRPVDGGSAVGRAIFGRIGKKVALQVVAKGLEPSPPGELYTLWLYHSSKIVLRIGAVKVDKSGGLAARFPIPTEVLAYVASGAFKQIDISLTSTAAYEEEVAKAKEEKRLPAYTGTDVLRGTITGPIASSGK